MTSQNRYNFDQATKASIRKQCGYICNNPSCRKFLWSPKSSQGQTGVVSHIIAASKKGPRANRKYPDQKREISNARNALFLCSNCDRLVDSNSENYPVQLLQQWKRDAEGLHMSFLDQMYQYSQTRKENRAQIREITDLKDELKETKEKVDLQGVYMASLIKFCHEQKIPKKTTYNGIQK